MHKITLENLSVEETDFVLSLFSSYKTTVKCDILNHLQKEDYLKWYVDHLLWVDQISAKIKLERTDD